MIDRKLAAVLFANGESFLPSAAEADRMDARETCYLIAIATELVLKAFLIARGWSDDRCRRDIRHDLEKAFAFSRKAGLGTVPGELDDVISVLNAYYPKHAFDRFVLPDESFPMRARSIVAELFGAVRPLVKASPVA